MDWKDIAGAVGKVAPLLGTLLAGPAGGAVGGLVASVLGVGNTADEVSQALATNPDAAVKLRQIEADRQAKLQELATDQVKAELAASTQNAGDINKTMQAEAAAEHWPTYSWRPAIGFAVAIDLVLSVLVVAIAYIGVMAGEMKPEVLSYLPAMLGAMAALVGVASPILGIASWFRGRMQADPAVPTNNRG
jgi:hypothetical protein